MTRKYTFLKATFALAAVVLISSCTGSTGDDSSRSLSDVVSAVAPPPQIPALPPNAQVPIVQNPDGTFSAAPLSFLSADGGPAPSPVKYSGTAN